MKFRLQRIIARYENSPPKTCSSWNWVFQPRRCKICVSNQVEQFSASYFRAGSAPVPPPSEGLVESGPEGSADGPALLFHLDALIVSVSQHSGGLDIDVVGVGVGVGGDGVNGLHDRLLSLLKARATSALGKL